MTNQRLRQILRSELRNNGLYAAWAVAVIATLGSLYFSEILKYEPCKWCWFQRVFMYPLSILLGIAAARKEARQVVYMLPLAVIGALISTYHILLQKTSWFKSNKSGCGLVPCDVDYINWFGFVTIPMLALTAFILIIVLLLAVRWATRGEK